MAKCGICGCKISEDENLCTKCLKDMGIESNSIDDLKKSGNINYYQSNYGKTNEELLSILYKEHTQYTEDALEAIENILRSRGVEFTAVSRPNFNSKKANKNNLYSNIFFRDMVIKKSLKQIDSPTDLNISLEQFRTALCTKLNDKKLPISIDLENINWDGVSESFKKCIIFRLNKSVDEPLKQYIIDFNRLGLNYYVDEKICIKTSVIPKEPTIHNGFLEFILRMLKSIPLIGSLFLSKFFRWILAIILLLTPIFPITQILGVIIIVYNFYVKTRDDDIERYLNELETVQKEMNYVFWKEDTDDIYGRFSLAVENITKEVVKELFSDCEIKSNVEKERMQEQLNAEIERRRKEFK